MPLPVIVQYGLFALDEQDFEELMGCPKPTLDETIVFSCAAGIRSVYAAKYAAQQGGYSKLVNYMGGAYEWFAQDDVR
jgi:rhodanese-related sulfurtransferase